jgi:hypothetical protein
MKKVLLIISVSFFLSISQSFAQKTIDEEDFKHLVDYANSKYVMTFIEKYDANKSDYIKNTYEKKVKPELVKSTLDSLGNIISSQTIIQLLQNNAPAQELAKKIEERKLKYADFSDNVSLINSLRAKSWKDIDLSTVAANIQNEILKKYNIGQYENLNDTTNQDEISKKNSHNFPSIEKYERLKNEIDRLKQIALGVLALLVIVLIFIFKTLKGRESIIKIVLESKRINKKFSPKTDIPNTNYPKPYTLTDEDINIIVDKVLECLKLNEEEKKQKQLGTQPKTTFKYLKGKTGKTFGRAENTPEDSFFRITTENGDTAYFEFFGSEEEAIAKRIFHEDICELSGNYLNARFVKMITPGTVERNEEQWSVTERIKIKLT